MSPEVQLTLLLLCIWNAIASTVAMIRSGPDDRQKPNEQ